MKRTPLARTAGLRRRTRLAPVSARRLAERPARAAVVAAVHARDRTCRAKDLWPEVACGGPLDVHEPLTRARGGNYLDPDQCVLLCRRHHDRVDEDPVRATVLGLLKRAPA